MTILEITIALGIATGVTYTTLEMTELLQEKIEVIQDLQKQNLPIKSTETKD